MNFLMREFRALCVIFTPVIANFDLAANFS